MSCLLRKDDDWQNHNIPIAEVLTKGELDHTRLLRALGTQLKRWKIKL